MYETFFSMKHTPFIRSIPTDMLYSDSETDEIQNRLVYASDRQLFATLVGDSGCGKTTALRRLHETLSGKGYTVLYVTESKLTPRNFYNNLLEQVKTQLQRTPRPLPTMKINPEVKDIFGFKFDDFTLENYDPWPAIKGEVSV